MGRAFPSPLWGGEFTRGEEERPDIRPLAAALEKALVGDPALRALPAKFGVLLDDGGAPSLATVPADLRFAWDGTAFAVGLGGTAADALDLGRVAPDDLVARAIAIAHRLLALPGAERPRAMMRAMGSETVADGFGSRLPAPRPAAEPPKIVGPRSFGGVPTFGLAAPFGRLAAAMLCAAADASAGELRLTPWRTLLLPGVAAAAVPGFITDPDDPRLRVAACTGASGCERGTTDTHADASCLAALAASRPGTGIVLHVSGCAKGCAHAERAPLSLVGRDGRYDLVKDGRPGDAVDVEAETIAGMLSIMSNGDAWKSTAVPHLPSPQGGEDRCGDRG